MTEEVRMSIEYLRQFIEDKGGFNDPNLKMSLDIIEEYIKKLAP